MRCRPLLRALLSAALLCVSTSSGAGILDRWNPFLSFETRCEALPAAHFEVVVAPVAFTEDYTLSWHDLSAKNERAQINHRTVGLTEARLAYESTIESRGIEKRGGGRACATPSIRVVFSAAPMVLFVAREYAQDECRRDMIREHELRHVAVYRTALREIAQRAERELPALFGSGLTYGANPDASQQAMRARMHEFMREFMRARSDDIKARQADIDTPEEYARLSRACAQPAT